MAWTLTKSSTQPLKATAALIANNLHGNGKQLAFTSQNKVPKMRGLTANHSCCPRPDLSFFSHPPQVFVVEDSARLESGTATVLRCTYNEKDSISVLKWCQFAFGTCLVLGTTDGLLHIYDESGLKLIHAHRPFGAGVPVPLVGLATDCSTCLYVGEYIRGDLCACFLHVCRFVGSIGFRFS